MFNGADVLPGTMASVFAQTYPHIEYIVVDGASTDGTIELLKKQTAFIENDRASSINFNWLYEKDRGLYDAMNKGLHKATGDFVCFLNAGDWLFDNKVIENLASLVGEKTDILYGETMLVNENRGEVGLMSELSTRKLPENLTAGSMRFGMVVVHQSFYVRRSIAPFYELQWKRCADIDWVINCLKKSRETVNANQVLTCYLMGGMSKKQHRESLKERFAILRKHFGLFPTLLAHGFIVLRAVFHKIKKMGGASY